jgi:hypothetical protein
MTDKNSTEEIVRTVSGDVTLFVRPKGDRFAVTANDHHDEEFYAEEFPTLAAALDDLHRFLMAEYAGSTYVRNAEEQKAYAAFA